MVETVNKCTATGAHKRVLQCTEQNPVQLLHVMLICSLKKKQKKTQQRDNRTRINLGTNKQKCATDPILPINK